MKMIMLGSSITAAEAHVNGLVAETFDDSTVLDNTIAIAEKLASSSSVALSFAKEAICGGELSLPVVIHRCRRRHQHRHHRHAIVSLLIVLAHAQRMTWGEMRISRGDSTTPPSALPIRRRASAPSFKSGSRGGAGKRAKTTSGILIVVSLPRAVRTS